MDEVLATTMTKVPGGSDGWDMTGAPPGLSAELRGETFSADLAVQR